MKIIEWISDNLFTLVIVAGVLAQLLKAIRGQKDRGAGDTAAPEQTREFEFEDPELAERTRKIREDIRRKIAERRRGGEPPVREEDSAPQPAAYEEPPPIVREVAVEHRPEPVHTYATRVETQRAAEILEQQAALAEQMRELELRKAAAARRTEFEHATADRQTATKVAARGAVLEDLRSPQALRRAFVLREVLGPPVALR
ncbi:MAG: hypothetical protein C0502_03885 [Opitutus sp.]|nr:hypothetical protein [Opitutus sp.]